MGAALGAGRDGLEASAGLGGGVVGSNEYRIDQVAATATSTAHTSAAAHRVFDENRWFKAASPRRRCGVNGAVRGAGVRASETRSLTAVANSRHRANLSSGRLASAVENTSSSSASSGRKSLSRGGASCRC